MAVISAVADFDDDSAAAAVGDAAVAASSAESFERDSGSDAAAVVVVEFVACYWDAAVDYWYWLEVERCECWNLATMRMSSMVMVLE